MENFIISMRVQPYLRTKNLQNFCTDSSKSFQTLELLFIQIQNELPISLASSYFTYLYSYLFDVIPETMTY